jgi:hypothetical protein
MSPPGRPSRCRARPCGDVRPGPCRSNATRPDPGTPGPADRSEWAWRRTGRREGAGSWSGLGEGLGPWIPQRGLLHRFLVGGCPSAQFQARSHHRAVALQRLPESHGQKDEQAGARQTQRGRQRAQPGPEGAARAQAPPEVGPVVLARGWEGWRAAPPPGIRRRCSRCHLADGGKDPSETVPAPGQA